MRIAFSSNSHSCDSFESTSPGSESTSGTPTRVPEPPNVGGYKYELDEPQDIADFAREVVVASVEAVQPGTPYGSSGRFRPVFATLRTESTISGGGVPTVFNITVATQVFGAKCRIGREGGPYPDLAPGERSCASPSWGKSAPLDGQPDLRVEDRVLIGVVDDDGPFPFAAVSGDSVYPVVGDRLKKTERQGKLYDLLEGLTIADAARRITAER